jgi:hypothetical protein
MREGGAESWRRSSVEAERWPACEEGRSGGSAGREPSGALVGGQASHEAQCRLVAMGARHWLGTWGIVVDGSPVAPGEQELEAAQCGPLGGVEQTEGAHAVQTAQRHVLEEAAQKLVGVQSHGFALAVAAVSIVEGDGAVVAGGDGLVGKRGAMGVASEIVEHDAGARDGLGEDDPALVPGDEGQLQAGHGAASEMAEATAKELGQGALGREKRLLASRRTSQVCPSGARPPAGTG